MRLPGARYPGLKPWAILLDHFMVKNQAHYSVPPFEDEDDLRRPQPLHLRCIMKDDANRVAAPGANPAYAVAQVHSISSRVP